MDLYHKSKRIAAAQIKGSERKVARLNEKVDNNTQRISENKITLGKIEEVQNSNKVFRFSDGQASTEKEVNGEMVKITTTTFARDEDGTYVINNTGSLANKSHELTHGAQIVEGLVDVQSGSTQVSSIKSGKVGDLEHEAYRANYGIDGDLGFGNTVEPVCGLDDPNFNDAVDKGKAQGGNQ